MTVLNPRETLDEVRPQLGESAGCADVLEQIGRATEQFVRDARRTTPNVERLMHTNAIT